jgi:hypothetical protein
VAIERDDVLPLVRAAVPAYVPEELEPGEERLPYLEVGDVLRAVEGDPASLDALLEVVERLQREGDAYVRELAVVGYLEDLQGFVAAGRLPDPRDRLGPLSAQAWRDLEDFWVRVSAFAASRRRERARRPRSRRPPGGRARRRWWPFRG